MGHCPTIFAIKVPEHYLCPDCKDVFENPEKGSCGHVLCGLCWIVNERYSIKDLHAQGEIFCPVCNIWYNILEFKIDPDKTLARLVNRLPVKCTHKGCEDIFALEDKSSHLNSSHCGCKNPKCRIQYK